VSRLIYNDAKSTIRGHYMIYENIRNLREDSDKTQKELADYLNVKQTTYSKYELGKINIPVEVFIKLADYYGVSVDYLLGRTKKK
jgi:transcriptional regulator with XRE-family HTH domain